jgi:hypothetical protein
VVDTDHNAALAWCALEYLGHGVDNNARNNLRHFGFSGFRAAFL